MGSGKGGGGGGKRVGGGGGAGAADQVKPDKGSLEPGEAIPPYQPDYYTDLPPVLNANRKLNADGEVIVGEKGALKSTGRFPRTEEAWDDAITELTGDVGIPQGVINQLDKIDGGILDVANALPKGSKYLGHGVEGVGIEIPNGKVLRVQYDGMNPLNMYNIGRSGVYADWKKKYGNIWIEQKAKIKYTASQALRRPRMADKVGSGKRKMMETFIPDVKGTMNDGKGGYTTSRTAKWADVDLHNGNWGFDSRGRPRVFDQGAVRPIWDQRYTAGGG